MGYRIYGEPEEKESLIGNFFLGVFIGAIVLYDGGAWVAVSCGWVNQTTMRLICLGIGVLIGMRMAFCCWLRLRKDKQTPEKKS